MKCGTTSLHYYLSRHPQVVMSRQKELNFFILERNWPKGVEWYKSNFLGEAVVYGEASPNYTYHPVFCDVPQRMKSVVPNARLIYVVRDPIERIISHFVHNCSEWRAGHARENRCFVEAVSDPADRDYVPRSLYGMQLAQYLPYYSKSDILIVAAEDLALHRRETLRKIFGFLDVDDTFDCPEFSRMKNRAIDKQRTSRLGTWVLRLGRKVLGRFQSDALAKIGILLVTPISRPVERPVVDEAIREKLVRLLQKDIDHLRDVTGLAFGHWSL